MLTTIKNITMTGGGETAIILNGVADGAENLREGGRGERAQAPSQSGASGANVKRS